MTDGKMKMITTSTQRDNKILLAKKRRGKLGYILDKVSKEAYSVGT